MSILTLTEPLPVIELVGGGKFTLVEPVPVLSFRGSTGGALVLTEPIPKLQLTGQGGVLAITEPLPVIALTGIWNSVGDIALTEPMPIFALSGNIASGFSITEPLPKLNLLSRIPGVISLTEPLPTLIMQGEKVGPGQFAFVEPIPILSLIGFLAVIDDKDAPGTGIVGEIRPLSDYTAWSLNPKNRAHAGFLNYEFSSLLCLNGEYYGTRDDGYFTLNGDTDDGEEIQTSNKWGPSDLGTSLSKRFYRALTTIRSRGSALILAITTNENTRTPFDIDPTGEEGLHIITTRGRRDVHGTEMAPELNNVDGGDWDVHELVIKEQRQPKGRG